jgi:hypothetical protein
MQDATPNKISKVLASHRVAKYKHLVSWSFIIFLLTLPAIVDFFFIKTHGVNVCFWDQWSMVPLFDKLYTGHLTIMDLFTQHNEHRIFFPQLVMLLIGVITKYNNIAEMYLSWVLLCLIASLLLRFYVCTFGATKRAMIKFIPVVWLIFSLRQWENLLWGYQIQFFMVVLFFILSLYLLATSQNSIIRFAASVLSGIICTFSLANGLLVWPIGLIQILWSWRAQGNESRRVYRNRLYIWCVIGMLAFVAYFIGYTQPSYHPSLVFSLQNPFSAISFFFVCIGSPLAVDEYTAAGIGILLLVLYIYVIIYKTAKKESSFSSSSLLLFSLILFALFSTLLLVVGRGGFGIGQATASRYTTLTTLGIVGVYLSILQIGNYCEKLRQILLGLTISLIALGIVVSYSHAIIVDGRGIQDYRIKAANYLVNFETQSDDNLKLLFSDTQVVRQEAEILRKYQLNVFNLPVLAPNKLIIIEGTTPFYVDSINNRPFSQQTPFIINSQSENTVTIAGWAIDQKAGETAGGVFININGQKDIPAIYGGHRPDVTEVYQNDNYTFSGFTATFPTSIFVKGENILSLKIITADKSGYYTPQQKIVLDVR